MTTAVGTTTIASTTGRDGRWRGATYCPWQRCSDAFSSGFRVTWIYEFKIVDARGRLLEVYVDAGTGTVLSVEGD
jgi:hypothetical protein